MSRPKRRGIGRKMRRSVQGAGWVSANCAASSHQPMGGSQSLSLAVGRTGRRSSLYFAFYMLLISSFGCFCPFCRYLKCKKIAIRSNIFEDKLTPPFAFQRMKFVICKSPEPPDITCQSVMEGRKGVQMKV